jgi:uncharacterized DUF497 family protein
LNGIIQKNLSNKNKHGIDFVDAIAVFDDPNRLEENSTKTEYGEIRTKVIGMMANVLIATVIYTDRSQCKRIISARPASKNERKRYIENWDNLIQITL